MKTFLELLNGSLRTAPAILFNSWFFSPWENQLAKAVVKVHERLVLLGRCRVSVKMGWILTSQSTGLREDIESLTDEGNKQNNSWLPKEVLCFPGGKGTWAESLSSPWGKNALWSSLSWANPLLYSVRNCIFFYSTSVLSLFFCSNHPFSNITYHWVISQAWKNNCWWSMTCIHPVIISRRKPIMEWLMDTLGHYSDQLLGEYRYITMSPKVSFW